MNERIKFMLDRLDRLLKKIEERPWAVYFSALLLSALTFFALLMAAKLLLPPKRDAPFLPTPPAFFLFNTLIIFALFAAVFALTNRWIFSIGLALFAAVAAGTVNIYKNRIIGTPLVPSDVYMIPQGIEMVSVLFSFAHWHLLLYLLSYPATAVGLFYAFRLRRPRVALLKRVLVLGCALTVPGWMFAYGWFPKSPLARKFPIPEVLWHKATDYNDNGMFVMFVIDAGRLLRPVPPPPGYSAEAIAAIARKCEAPTTTTAAMVPHNPNVILFLAESFFDVASLGIQTTADPSPFFHSLSRDGVSGHFLVPTFGGMTTRTEFEILTGLTMAFMPEIIDPYASNLNFERKLPALPAFFARRNYRTVAIHAFPEMGECREVYPLLGFQRYIGSNEFKNKRKRGDYVADGSLVDKVIEVADGYTKKKKAYFMLADNMGTHGSYDRSDVTDLPLDVLTTMTKASHVMLKNYVNAVADMDASLSRMVDHFRQAKNPTVIIIFGDHLPILGDDFKVYQELGYYRHGSKEMETRIRMTPLAAWANFPLPPGGIATRAPTLYSYVIKAAGLPLNEYGRFNEYLARSLTPDNKIPAKIEREYRLVQYDLLHGGRYFLGGLK